MKNHFVSLLSVLIGPCLAASVAWAEPVVIFAAASLKGPLDEISELWNQSNDPDIIVSYGGSGAMAAQIMQGAPADIFFSANVQWMDVLEAQEFVVSGHRIDLLANELVLIAPLDRAEVFTGSGLTALADPRAERVAIGNVRSVPAGIYARAALEKLSLWEIVGQKAIETESVRSALQLVALGEVSLGIVYATDALADQRVTILERFAEESHLAIVYPVSIIRDAAMPETQLVFTYLQSDAASEIFMAHGFDMVAAE